MEEIAVDDKLSCPFKYLFILIFLSKNSLITLKNKGNEAPRCQPGAAAAFFQGAALSFSRIEVELRGCRLQSFFEGLCLFDYF